ncbi:MAG: NADH-quinone oxidoreductase subunit M [Pirellulaceae bacterium]|nr:NADH-quinone oxidoreductase subunit M [Pirellulaceae bacterium]
MDNPTFLLSFIVFAPAIGALILAFFPKGNADAIRLFTLVVTVVVMVPAIILALPKGVTGFSGTSFDLAADSMQNVFRYEWIPSFDIEYFMGIDGISFPLVLLTAVISVLAMGASWSITKHVKGYCILFLLLETGMLGVFMSLDFFLFYVFWEVMLLPMYFLIGIWGGTRKEYAAIKFFLYTLFGSVLMLIAILMLYFNSDLTELTAEQLVTANVVEMGEFGSAEEAFEEWTKSESLGMDFAEKSAKKASLFAEGHADAAAEVKLHTFNVLAMQQMGQHTELFSVPMFGCTLQCWAFILLFIGFVIKVPSVPVHTWLPDAHVQAPTPISMILAGVLLKMGGYGIIRMCYPICPAAGLSLAPLVCGIGVVSMVYGAFAAMAQKDFKRLVAYSSVSHMGYVVLGLGVWSAAAGNLFVSDYWNMGVKGAMFQMIAHGISSAGMFFMVGVLYDRVHHRNLAEFGGIYGKMPLYTGLAIVLFFAGLGLPGLCGFIGEVLVVLSVWEYSHVLAIISAAVVILTAGYILWAVQRVYLGAEYLGPHEEALTPLKGREFAVAFPLVVLAIVLGIFPGIILQYMDPTIDRQINELVSWQERNQEKPASTVAVDELNSVDELDSVEETKKKLSQNAPRPRDDVFFEASSSVVVDQVQNDLIENKRLAGN